MHTFDNDHSLPAIPVPELEDTCRRLKQMIKPLTDSEGYEEASSALDAFSADHGVRLQESLHQLADSGAHNSSWLRPIWDDMYLSFRGMLPVNMNFAFQFVRDWWGGDGLSILVSALAQTIGKMRTESLPAESSRDIAQSMGDVGYMIYTRIPGKVRDTLYFPPLSGPMTASVVCKGQWFILSLTDAGGTYLPAPAIAAALNDIRKQAEAGVQSPIVGIITSSDRESAAHLREMLQASPGNRMNLERIEKSVFTICLDDPLDVNEEFNLRLISGKPGNRWFDKSLQIISDGADLGVNIEHSGCDAGIWIYLLKQAGALKDEVRQNCAGIGAHILPLAWRITEAMADKLEIHAETYRKAIKKLSFCSRRIEKISREKIRAIDCSPDAFVQLLYQAAYYSLTDRFCSVYEAVSTRGFYQGRTECARPVTEESAGFISALRNETDKNILIEKFNRATGSIGEIMKRSQQALGPERHMAGLSIMSQIIGTPAPDIFAAEGYKTLRRDTLSTSNISAPFIDFFSFGPVVDDGFGIGYGIKENALHLSVSAYDISAADPGRFIDEVENAAETLFQIFRH